MEKFDQSKYNNMYFAALCDIMKRCGYIEEIEKRQEAVVVELLKSKDIDTDDTEVCNGISGWLNLLFGSNAKTKEKLKKLKDTTTSLEVKNKLKKVINIISRKRSCDVLAYNGQNEVSPVLNSVKTQIIIRRDIAFLEYFIAKEHNAEYTPEIPYTGNVGKFENLSRNQLVDYFKVDKFYMLNDHQKLQLLQAVANDYCKLNGVNSCAVTLEELPYSDKSICYGEYQPAQSKILLNKRIFDLLDDAKYCKNQYLPMKILSTVIHEAQHRVQFETLDKTDKTEREQLVSDSINKNKRYQSFNKYLVEPEELDARECALEYIKQCARETQDEILEKYYNTLVLEEQKNGKSNVPINIQHYFQHIYSIYSIPSARSLTNSQKEFKGLLKQKQWENE